MTREEKKKLAREQGKIAEELAAQRYLKEGYAILRKNWHSGKNEIDIVAQKNDNIVIIEVKYRSGEDESALDSALESVSTDKKRRMVRSADSFLRQLDGAFNYRFDIVTVTSKESGYEIEVYEDAFLAADLF